MDYTSLQLERLSNKQLLRLSEIAENIKQSDKKEQLNTAIEYFSHSILPIMKEYAEMSGSLLVIEENDNRQTIIVTFKCSQGFDITESCRLMKTWFIVASHIGISIENGEPTLSLIFDYNELC